MGCGFRLRPRWEAASHSDHKSRVVLSAKTLNRKAHPVSQPNTGMHFPQSPSTGNHIPFQRQIPGHGFRNPAHPEIPPTPHTSGHRTISLLGLPSIKGRPRVTKKAPRISRLSHLYCFARRTANGEATLPARPSWRLQPCCPDLPWWDGPSRQPSCRAAS